MIKSMTGFGKGEASVQKQEVHRRNPVAQFQAARSRHPHSRLIPACGVRPAQPRRPRVAAGQDRRVRERRDRCRADFGPHQPRGVRLLCRSDRGGRARLRAAYAGGCVGRRADAGRAAHARRGDRRERCGLRRGAGRPDGCCCARCRSRARCVPHPGGRS